MAKRKIGFYYVLFKKGDLELPAWNPILTICNYLTTLEKSIRKKDLEGNKFGFISEITSEEDDLASILFKSAKHSYRAPLLDRNTVEERENPKTMDEGEQMKTHMVLKKVEDSLIALIESGNNLMTGKNIIDYLNFGLSLYNSNMADSEKLEGVFSLEMMPRDDFEEVLGSMNRVTCASIFIDKSILGSEMLNYTEPSETMQADVILQIKANRKKSILDSLYHIVDKYNGNSSNIRRIRVIGKTGSNNNETIIDTGFIIKKEYVEVVQNSDTGEFSSVEMFQAIKELSNQFG